MPYCLVGLLSRVWVVGRLLVVFGALGLVVCWLCLFACGLAYAVVRGWVWVFCLLYRLVVFCGLVGCWARLYLCSGEPGHWWVGVLAFWGLADFVIWCGGIWFVWVGGLLWGCCGCIVVWFDFWWFCDYCDIALFVLAVAVGVSLGFGF